jgi:orotate phosphoribosyltransferase
MENALDMVRAAGAIRTDGHFVYASGRHGSTYVNKDAIFPDTRVVHWLTLWLALRFRDDGVQAVVAPAVAGIVLSQWTAWHLEHWGGRGGVASVYAEKRGRGFVLRRGYDAVVAGKRTLVVEDVLTTGGTAAKVVRACRRAGATVIGVGALVDRGGVTAAALGVPKAEALVALPIESWGEAECPLCAAGVPVDTDVGKGAAFLSRTKAV